MVTTFYVLFILIHQYLSFFESYDYVQDKNKAVKAECKKCSAKVHDATNVLNLSLSPSERTAYWMKSFFLTSSSLCLKNIEGHKVWNENI